MTGFIPVPPDPWVPTATDSETKLFPAATMDALDEHNDGRYATTEQGEKADSAYQLPEAGVPATDLEDAVQTSLGKADEAVPNTVEGRTALAASPELGAAIADAVAAREQVVRATVSSGTYTVDPTATGTLLLTLDGDATLAFGAGFYDGQSILVRVFQDSAGGHTLTLPAAEGDVTLDETALTFETLVYQYLTGVGLVVHQAPAGPYEAPAPALLLPTELSALVWYDAESLVGSVSDGGAVNSWADLSGNARTALYQSGTHRTLDHDANGLGIPGVHFNGTAGLLRPSTWTPPILDGGLCIVSLFYVDALTGSSQHLAGGANSGGNTRAELYMTNAQKLSAYGSSIVSDADNLELDVLHIAFAQFRTGDTTQVWVDGELAFEGSTGTAPTGSSHSIGSGYTGSTPLDGWIVSQTMIPSVLTADERYGLTAGLSDRYGDLLSGML